MFPLLDVILLTDFAKLPRPYTPEPAIEVLADMTFDAIFPATPIVLAIPLEAEFKALVKTPPLLT